MLTLDGGVIGGPIEVHEDGGFVLSDGVITIPRFLLEADAYVTANDSATVNITGGVIDHFADFSPQTMSVIQAKDNSQVSISGGILRSWIEYTIVARGSSHVLIDGGEIQSKDTLTLLIDESSTLSIFGGTIYGGEDDGVARVAGQGTLNVHGGSLLHTDDDGSIVFAEGSGVVNIFGGRFQGDSDQTEIRLSERAVANIYGYGLTQAGGELTGLLLDANRLWLDFQTADNAELRLHEMISPDVTGDLNHSMRIDGGDIDLLAAAIRHNIWADPLDTDEDGIVGPNDLDVFVMEILQTWRGDSNLDGEFNSKDFVDVFTGGEYEDDLELNSVWSTGDWNGDMEFGTEDLVLAFQDGGYEQGPRGVVIAVPEPKSLTILMSGLMGFAFCRRRIDSCA
jgi:hypothetical protein